METATMTLGLRVSDVSGQKAVRASAVPASFTVGELVQKLIAKMGLSRNEMGLARNDVEGRPLNYQARLEREGRHLNGAETVGDALSEDDELVLTPNIDAG
ncbi:MAG: hypothetical protein E6J79_19185 [Deltaproteobacteria bacterium]|nr:MAG: hypothetical protein E6J79_19185 [Deltaproteobacteria bacterium]